MMIPQIMPATTIRTAAGKLNDDALMSALRDSWSPTVPTPEFDAQVCVTKLLPGVNIRVHLCAMIRKRRYTLKRRAEN
ncbi:MAG: hypothetical protein WCC81_00345, partial [Pseudolabrys sp.]